MILIADSGASKTEWAIVDGKTVKRFFSQGYNPNYISGEEIAADLKASIPEGTDVTKVESIYFYGAGITPLNSPMMEKNLREIFPAASTVYLTYDLPGAARALLGRSKGFAGILGTGTNSCLWDGENVAFKVASLGFILGDEGSGAYIGKRFVCDWMRGLLPPEITPAATAVIGMEPDLLIKTVYTKPFPNRFCASFMKHISDNLHTHPYYSNLVRSSFRDFFRAIVTHYPDYQHYSFNCVGGVAYAFQDILLSVASEFSMSPGTVLPAPMDGLIRFHAEHV